MQKCQMLKRTNVALHEKVYSLALQRMSDSKKDTSVYPHIFREVENSITLEMVYEAMSDMFIICSVLQFLARLVMYSLQSFKTATAHPCMICAQLSMRHQMRYIA
eukprot:255632-Pelagomonas_calceolata.AAC.1